MATKSRLGMGLGALFPSLPGESAKSEAAAEPAATAVGVKADNKPSAKTSGSMAGSAAVPSARKNTGAKSSMATAQASVDAVHDMKKNVSHETKKGSVHRASMPSITLNEAAHPADMFFGSTSPVAPSADAKQESVSRETAAVKKNEDAKNDELELLPVQGGYLVELRLSDVGPNLHQPRTIFDEDDLRELADSIKEVGVLQPIVVRKRPFAQIEAARKENAAINDESHNMFDGRMDSMYELIMGERRWRASQIAGLKTIPAIVKTTADDDMLRDALLENLHRVALNPLEEAAAYQQMIDDFGLTQAQLSKSVSKSRPQIANTLRLLNLPATVQKKVASGLLSAGHARALLGLPTEADMEQLATRIISEGLSVRSTEEIVSMKAAESDQPKKAKTNKLNPWAGTPMQLGLEKKFGTKVSIKGSKEHGRIEIVFKSEDDMKRIVDMLIPSAEE
ncbi:ParB/RepB/Spo0J family partition protein [Bifidobacterium catenulatum subsp. kashiwanohense]|uniref:ParB/RepB/Spo0J family partition protein n=1 Tax=Bifidobacterium catenulatum subsp. kashiwanohense TaxID=630129 RepID=A0AAJ1P8C4_9BIFI|nr:ParB/RepB/Spo0J family partition protein [Bifidobacterium catenulatum]MDH7870316.1 ParB/RepB/Spo0J family partition protein [Bifidobacterium catenulatum subsp. kashiwanohense]MDH7872252.1 ParB/RepB/Spo0J family partition protein [Bifidobacterium catenulatum subsp. kashiwanohense]MDH7885165.1 ParB/RepB/Spo0J family partition protein [Bifidobacterium catenulatum subsp. kashiwanohense]MDH7887062.1 ParB/RepB/Spo0J family partition protein [Bifidobacterium catenulatum subsp. kashiwanohense]MDH78